MGTAMSMLHAAVSSGTHQVLPASSVCTRAVVVAVRGRVTVGDEGKGVGVEVLVALADVRRDKHGVVSAHSHASPQPDFAAAEEMRVSARSDRSMAGRLERRVRNNNCGRRLSFFTAVLLSAAHHPTSRQPPNHTRMIHALLNPSTPQRGEGEARTSSSASPNKAALEYISGVTPDQAGRDSLRGSQHSPIELDTSDVEMDEATTHGGAAGEGTDAEDAEDGLDDEGEGEGEGHAPGLNDDAEDDMEEEDDDDEEDEEDDDEEDSEDDDDDKSEDLEGGDVR